MKFTPISFITVCYSVVAMMSAAPAFAQSTAGDVQASVVPRSTVTRIADLQFGNIVTGNVASRVVVNPAAGTRSITSGNAIPFGGAVTAAEFEVLARPLLFYQIIVPMSATITRDLGSETMTVTNFTLDGSSLRLLPLFNPVGRFKVGARLNVGANQVAGSYAGDFAVTVNYF